MIAKTFLTALALTVLPAMSHAFCSERGNHAQSCAQGMVWDHNQQACVERVNS